MLLAVGCVIVRAAAAGLRCCSSTSRLSSCMAVALIRPARPRRLSTTRGRSRPDPRTDQDHGIVGRHGAAIISQHGQVVGGDASVGGKGADDIDLTRARGLVHQRGIHAALFGKRQPVACDQGLPLAPRKELIVGTDAQAAGVGASWLIRRRPSR